MNERKKAHKQVFQNNYHLGKWAILGPKIAYHNSGSTVRISLSFGQ